MKKWLHTCCDQLLDLNRCKNFWIEDTDVRLYQIRCQDEDDIEWMIGEFQNLEEDQKELIRIFSNLVDMNWAGTMAIK